MLLGVGRVDVVVDDREVLRRKLVELRVQEHVVGVLGLGEALLDGLLLEGLLLEHQGLLLELALQLGRLRVKAVVVGQQLARRRVLPHADRQG